MAVAYYEGKDNKPARLFVSSDRVTFSDRIYLSEAYFAIENNLVSLYGVLSFESIGIENSKDKTWKPDNQKVLLSFYRDKKPTWNNETRKFEDKEVEPSENYLYGFAKDVLSRLTSEIVTVVITPYVNPQFLEEMKTQKDELTIKYWEEKVKNTVVASAVSAPQILTEADAEILKTSVNSSTGSTKTYQKAETETEKLNARFEFLKYHLGTDYPINTLYELGAMTALEPMTPEGMESQKTLIKALEIITQMWK
ncbi:hypothetical protein QUA71_26090 [Microcoleus sp. MON1_C5]|uniref:hypothetical protein n=1 Tax=Microcoleus sp. MON1_C5 TaxID=2818828 RepID=UPI002FD54E12